ncbi:hypothetical protein Barb6XT_02928 [Bacteroidales bacterium Barb6XT]|nr:hypothetical protein Barb6XT_02928 [Bacteroidales bacterium Barb6XT]
MKTKKQNGKSEQAASEDKQQEANVTQPKRYNKFGEWYYGLHREEALIEIVDMKAVLR